MAVLAATHRLRPRGVVPSRLSTLYWRSNPVPIPRLTMALDMTARANTPGARKSTPAVTPSGKGKTSTREKNTSNNNGITMLTRSCSPLRRLSISSARTWATKGLTGVRLGALCLCLCFDGSKVRPARLDRRTQRRWRRRWCG